MSWEVVEVRRVGEVALGRQRSPSHAMGPFQTPYLRVANVFDGWIDYSDVLAMSFTPAERQRFYLEPGDILLNEGQSLELVGRSAIYTGPQGKYCFQNTLVRFRVGGDSVPEFCQAVFKRWLDIGHFARVARQTTSVAHLGADRFARMLFARPPKGEQQAIAAALGDQEAHALSAEERKRVLCVVRDGLASDLLTGRVQTLTQQPNGKENHDI
jgi:type I restriction enzyme S subunit